MPAGGKLSHSWVCLMSLCPQFNLNIFQCEISVFDDIGDTGEAGVILKENIYIRDFTKYKNIDAVTCEYVQ